MYWLVDLCICAVAEEGEEGSEMSPPAEMSPPVMAPPAEVSGASSMLVGGALACAALIVAFL